jgi:hypothetical protein
MERSLGGSEESLAMKWAITAEGKVIRKDSLTWGCV